ncbi:MAG: hypothetical protein IJW98_03185 [Clostridia bacterium]|nr:hypothetical protein [Clostridia bacterium]
MKYYLKKVPDQKVPWTKTHDRMFISYSERHGSAYFEFQYYKKDLPAKRAAKDYQRHWLEDSLYAHMDWQNALMDHYLPYLKETYEPDGDLGEFCYFAPNYYSKAQTAAMIERIRADRPPEWEILLPWLERAAGEYNGFFLQGI